MLDEVGASGELGLADIHAGSNSGVMVEEVGIQRVRFENKNSGQFTVLDKYSIIVLKERSMGDTREPGYVVIISIIENGEIHPLPPVKIVGLDSVDVLAAQLLSYVDDSDVEVLSRAIMHFIKYFDLYRLQYEAALVRVKQAGFSLGELQQFSALNMMAKPSVREQIAELLANTLMRRYSFATVHDELLCYQDGIYVRCEKKVEAYIEVLVADQPIKAKVTRSTVSEVIGKLKRRSVVEAERFARDRFILAFNNGLFNTREWVENGSFALSRYDPSIYAVHRIPHRLDQDLFRRMMEEEGIGLFAHPVDIAALAEKYTPKTWKAYSDWVGEEQAPLLYEIEGYTLYPDYPIHKAFLLVGEGSNGKSTYLRKLRVVLGPSNVSSVTLAQITNPSQRFAVAELHRKLANLSGEPGKGSKGRIRDTDIFKKLTGGDLIMAERKFKDPFQFVNYAKMIFSANRLPEVDEDTHAFWRRWEVVKFPNQFRDDPTFFDRTFTEAEVEAGIIVSLFALRNVLLRRSFTGTKVDVKEEWMRRSNNVYRFVKEMLEGGYIELSPEAFVLKADLYSLYVMWARDVDEDPKKKRKFTEDLMRYFGVKPGKKKIRGRTENVYFGVRIVRNPYDEESEEESEQGLLGWA
ncbi:MAG: phage/plasmid primase, P4 family [Desulfurococcales archaeon]|nr:phage/plasmid primase, P4 family [Desulfurococcales archaeon]